MFSVLSIFSDLLAIRVVRSPQTEAAYAFDEILRFVGSALVLLLVGTGWFFPQPIAEPIRSAKVRPAIRISSVEQLPERVVLDTTFPTIAAPSVLEFAERWPREPATPVEHLSTQAPPAPITAAPRKQNPAKQERAKKIAAAPKSRSNRQ